MESANIKKLLESYFEGNTSLEEENILKNYFSGGVIADELVQYQPIFAGLKTAKEERSTKEFTFPSHDRKKHKTRWFSIAAILVAIISIGFFYFTQPQYTEEELAALATFEKAKEAMVLLSENFNKGAEQLTYIDQFTITKNKIFE